MSFARVFSAQPAIPHAHLVSVEADVSRGLHAFSVVGLPDKAVEESRDRISAAIKYAGFASPKSTNKKITISLAPAALKKEGSSFDLALALAYLLSAEDIAFDAEGMLFAGELSLDGSVRPVNGALSMALAAREGGFRTIFVPRGNAGEAALVREIEVVGIGSLPELIAHLVGRTLIESTPYAAPVSVPRESSVSLEDIRGQEHAKRALEVAAAGRHNIAFEGPPGTGKTLLARALQGLLPPLSEEEVIEVTSIHSVAGALDQQPITEAPFRAPHHTASYASLIGGGVVPKPGEVTLAHRGVLFADEFPEFNRDVINALRQPLEDRVVSVSRVRGTAIFPANFMLVAALNPCPCGRLGSARCTCAPIAIERYRRKIAGPIADRIDMWVTVGDIPLETLAKSRRSGEKETEDARSRILNARGVQRARFAAEGALTTNSDMGPKTLERYAKLSDSAEQTALVAASRMRLSPRGYHRTIKLARTIADLAGSDLIETEHMLEALQYRPKE